MTHPKKGRLLTHAFLVVFTLAVLFPVLKVFQIALQDRQTFDMRLTVLPDFDRLTLNNFADVVTRSRVDGLGPQVSDQEIARLSMVLSTVPQGSAQRVPDDGHGWHLPGEMVELMGARRCFACHRLREYGRDGLGGSLDEVGRLGEAEIAARLKAPTGAMQRKTVWLFGHQLFNSLVVATATTLLGIFLATTAAYAFSRFRFPGRRAGLLGFLVVQMFPGTMMMIPLYILVDRLGLLDQLLGLVLVYATTAIPFCVWMLKGYFDTIPKELEEAAIIDGASRVRIFWTIILPMARPAIAVTGLFAFMTAWNEYILAETFMNDETATTLPVMLNAFVSKTTVEWGHFAAGAILVSLPVIVLFFVLQRHLVGGLTAGGVKG